ncbi:catenin delta-2-like isoform X3 [Bolinopsis microptera]|uniref:catenin delta-2-like isoform X3 n=1 Tax=Bolinopsis microptera TaxID=2820187 RepID=UPI00307A704C
MGLWKRVSRLACFIKHKKREVANFTCVAIRFRVGKKKCYLWNGDSPPSSPDNVLGSKPSDIDKLYKQFYRENAHTPSDLGLQFRAPSDLDYYPTKQTPKVYPKSPKPAPKTYGAHSSALLTSSIRSHNGSSSGLSRPGSRHSSNNSGPPPYSVTGVSSLAGGATPSVGGATPSVGGATPSVGGLPPTLNSVLHSDTMPYCGASSCSGSQANIFASTPLSFDVMSGRNSQSSGRYTPSPSCDLLDSGTRKMLNTSTGDHMFTSGSSIAERAISPPIQTPVTRGYASSMPVLDTENIEPNKGCGGYVDSNKLAGARTASQISYNNSRITNLSRQSLNKRPAKKCSDNTSAGSSTSSEPELQDILNILTGSSNLALVNTAAGALQHLSYGSDLMKNKIRDAGAIPILVHMLSLDDLVCISSLGVLRNLSFGKNNHLNRIAIQDAHGITLLVQLLNTTESFEIQELVTGVFWNLSSSDTLKIPILKQALEPLVKNIIIPLSGWKETQGIPFDQIGYNPNISWTTVFRNATGCLKNLSSAGLEGRTLLRLCHGLVDSLLWTVRSAQGKNDVDNKAVENAVCILRNLSYRLEAEVAPEVKYGAGDDWRSRGLGGGQFRRKTPEEGKKKKKGKGREVNVTPLPDHTAGVGLLWQSGVVRVYLDLLLECSNPETLEGAAGALQNLTACSWEPAQAIRETVRKEKGLSVITSLLRLPNDLVVRATAFCLRNLAIDHKNKELLGKHATLDLVKRLPGGDGMDGITDITITGVVSAVSEIVADSQDNARIFRDYDGVGRLMIIARSQDIYNRQCVFTSNKILAALWEVKDIKRQLKSMGWNISFYTRLQTLDRSNDGMAGMEYDETRNQFRISGSDKPALPDHCVKSPDPTFDSHTMGRNHGTPDMLSPALTTITSSPSNHVTSPNSHVPSLHQYQMTSSQRHVSSSPAHSAEYESPLQNRSSTLGRNNNSVLPHKSYQQEPPELPQRGHSTLPSRNYQSNRYTVADSWV